MNLSARPRSSPLDRARRRLLGIPNTLLRRLAGKQVEGKRYGALAPDAYSFRVDKMHGALRQLNVAIRLHFDADDPVAVLTLAGAASTVFSDLVQLRL